MGRSLLPTSDLQDNSRSSFYEEILGISLKLVSRVTLDREFWNKAGEEYHIESPGTPAPQTARKVFSCAEGSVVFRTLQPPVARRPRVETGEGIAHVEKPRCVPSPGFLYSFVLPEVFASANVYRVVVRERLVSSEKSKERELRSGIDDGEQIVKEDRIAIVIVSPRRFREFPHLVMYPTSGRDAQPEQLVEDVETTIPFLRPTAGRELQCAIGGPEKGRVIWYYQIKITIKAYFTGFHHSKVGSGII